MFDWINTRLIDCFYKLLIVKVVFVDKVALPDYVYLKNFCDLQVATNQGIFTFIFKQDRRSKVRTRFLPTRILSSYFVELIAPSSTTTNRNTLRDHVVHIVTINTGQTNYQALANILLDNYLHEVRKL